MEIRRKKTAAARFFRPHPLNLLLLLHLFFSSENINNNNINNTNSARRLRGPLDRGHGRRLDGHGERAGGRESFQLPRFFVFVGVIERRFFLFFEEEDGHDDARRSAARPLPPSERRRLGLDRHLELPGERSFFLSCL